MPRSVYHLACSRSRCVITLALLVSGCICSSHASHVGATLGQLYVDESRVGLDDSQVWRDEYDFTGSWAGLAHCLGCSDVDVVCFTVSLGWGAIVLGIT